LRRIFTMSNSFTIEENKSLYSAKIKVVGVGGGGGNMINHIIRENPNLDIDLMIANTDARQFSCTHKDTAW